MTDSEIRAADPTQTSEGGPPAETFKPVGPSARIESVDVLRGFALMGILVVNIQSFALSGLQDVDPRIGSDFEGANYFAWLTTRLLFHSKVYPIFSMLFGAGLVLMDQRASEQSQSLWRIYYRRLFWLLAIGMLHAYFVWPGDILVAYAMCGAILFPMRRLSPKILVPLGLIGYSVIPALALGAGFLASWVEASAMAADQAGEQATELQSTMQEIRDSIRKELAGTPEQLEEERAIMHGGYWQLFRHRALYAFGVQIGFVFVLNWGFLGVMMLGVSLMRVGVFSASRPVRFYVSLGLLGYGLGWPMVGAAMHHVVTNEFDIARRLLGPFQVYAYGSLLVALGHVGLVLSVFKTRVGQVAAKPLAAAGRMALTNYLCQSLTCAAVFYGWGFSLFGRLDRFQLWGVVLVIWVVQLSGSMIWLRFFRLGPAEWVWRSLTYRTQQPMRPTCKAGDSDFPDHA